MAAPPGTLALPDADRARRKGALWMGPELDLYYMRNRWYEPATGRFLSEDPIGLQGGINPVVFATGNPANGRDPSGLDTKLTDDPRECLALGKSVAFRGGHLVCEDIVQKLPDIGAEAPAPDGPPDPLINFPDPPCPDCGRRDPSKPPAGPAPPSCSALVVSGLGGLALDAAGLGLAKNAARVGGRAARAFFISRWARANGRAALSLGKAVEGQVLASTAASLGGVAAAVGAYSSSGIYTSQLDLPASSGLLERGLSFLENYAPFGSGITLIRGVTCFASS